MSAPARVDHRPGGPGPETAFSSRVLSLPAPHYEGMLPQPVRQGPKYLKEIVLEIGTQVASGSLVDANQATAAVKNGIPHNERLRKLSKIRTDDLAAAEDADPARLKPDKTVSGLHKTDAVTGFLADAAEQITWYAVSRQHPGFDNLNEHDQIEVLREAGELTHGFVRRVLYAGQIEAEALAHPPKKEAVTVLERESEPARTVYDPLDEARALLAVQQQTRPGELPAERTREEQLRLFAMLDEDPTKAHLIWPPEALSDAF